MLFGYARISTVDQNPVHQIDALMRASVEHEHIYLDTTRGAEESRPQLDLLLRVPRTDDTLKITWLDRLGRSVLHERGVGLQVLEQCIDTATVEGRAMFAMLSVLERELVVANTRYGMAGARARGRAGGRRPRLAAEQVKLAQQLYDAGDKTVQQIADLFGVPRITVYGHLDKATVGRRAAPAVKTRRWVAREQA